MAQRTYSGHASRGRQLIDGRSVAFERGTPVDVSDDEANVLDREPDWGGTAAPEPEGLDALDKPALLAFADAHGIDVSRRLGEAKLRDAIAAALPDEPDEPDPKPNKQGSEPDPKES